MKERMGEVGEGEIVHLERRLGILGTIATIAPLMGLLGTITGMIQVFRQISTEADPAVSALAGGIWEALLTTAAGLVVAIPAYVGHRYLQGMVEDRSQELADACYAVLAQTHPHEEESP
jgi:biopolymer transport protein ExbB